MPSVQETIGYPATSVLSQLVEWLLNIESDLWTSHEAKVRSVLMILLILMKHFNIEKVP